MTETELEDAIDAVILESKLPLGVVAGVLDAMKYRYEEEADNADSDDE